MTNTIIANSYYATASPGGDAPRGLPVLEVINEQAGLSTFHTESLLHRKVSTNFDYWNVRTMLDPVVQAITMHTLWKYNIQVACLSEVRLPDSGHRVIEVPNARTKYHLYYSGVTSFRTSWCRYSSEHCRKLVIDRMGTNQSTSRKGTVEEPNNSSNYIIRLFSHHRL